MSIAKSKDRIHTAGSEQDIIVCVTVQPVLSVGRGHRGLNEVVFDFSIVAEHQIVAAACMDYVITKPAEDDIVSAAAGDDVISRATLNDSASRTDLDRVHPGSAVKLERNTRISYPGKIDGIIAFAALCNDLSGNLVLLFDACIRSQIIRPYAYFA